MHGHGCWGVIGTIAIGWLALAPATPAADGPATTRLVREVLPDLDVRLRGAAAGAAPLGRPSPAARAAGEALLRQRPQLRLRWDEVSGSPRWFAAPAGETLASPRPGSPEEIARTFLAGHLDLFAIPAADSGALALTDVVPAAPDGHHLYFEQRLAGIAVDGGRARVTLRGDGAVLSVASRLFADLEPLPPPSLGAADALRAAARVYSDLVFDERVLERAGDRPDHRTVFAAGEFARPPRARLVVFPEPDGARLAWEVELAEPSRLSDYRILIDAWDGSLLARHNRTFFAGGHIVAGDQPVPETEEYEPVNYAPVNFPASTPQSPGGWIAGAGTELSGNNASTHFFSVHQPGPSSPTGQYDFPFNTDSSSLVTAWYWVNDAHDRFYALGFDEAAGNFQLDNFGNGGAGGDPVRVVSGYQFPSFPGAFAATGLFAATPDGEPPTLAFTWNDCRFCADHTGSGGGDRSTGFAREVLVHEYAHGVTSRRVGGPSDVSCLEGTQSRAMAEGWSDLFAASFFDDPSFGEYVTQGGGFLRDLRQDLGYGDLCDIMQPGSGFSCTWVDQNGMIWGGALWDLRESMRALDPASGLDDFHVLLVEALALTPCNPSMLDGRDAILAADTALFASAHHGPIWHAFAAHGMGLAAATLGENDEDPLPDDTVPAPFACAAPATPADLTASPDGSNAVRLDYDATGAAAVEIWRDDLDNPADRARPIAFTTSTTAFVDSAVEGGKTYRYPAGALSGAGVDCRSGASGTGDATAAGDCGEPWPRLIPELTITDGDPSCEVTLSWNAASPACPGSAEPIVYNVYRSMTVGQPADTPGFLPSERLLIGRTTGTTFADTPPQLPAPGSWFGNSSYYLVLAQHGTLDDPPDHGDRGTAQVLDWEPAIPVLGRTVVESWDFESGPQGWTSFNWTGQNPSADWMLVSPAPTRWGGALLAPDQAPDGEGQAWVTGDAGGGPSTITSHNAEELHDLRSPTWDATGGGTLVSFDYWASAPVNELYAGLAVGPFTAGPIVRDFGMPTIQGFDAPGRHGWQRAQIDLATLAAPTASYSMRFSPADGTAFAEYGIDNVLVERGTVCERSALALAGVTIDDSSPGWGNGNGVLEPGEIAGLTVEIRNDGAATALSPAATIASGVAGVAILDGAAAFPDTVPAATTTSAANDFLVAVPGDVPCDGTVVFEIVLTATTGERTTELWSPPWGEVITDVLFQDDFETDQGWTASVHPDFSGAWERGEPNGTLNGADQSNPDTDSPGDAGDQCYVTGNSGGPPNRDDVDPGASPTLVSPAIAVSGFSRVQFDYDFWLYRSNELQGDRLLIELKDDAGISLRDEEPYQQGAWESQSQSLVWSQLVPVTTQVRLALEATDAGGDDVVEAGVDNVRVTGQRQQCSAVEVQPPSAVGDTLLLGKSGPGAELQWAAPVADGTHDPAAYYRVHATGSLVAPAWSVAATPAVPSASRAVDGSSEFYLVSAHNAGGSSGEEP